jgi:protein TonB
MHRPALVLSLLVHVAVIGAAWIAAGTLGRGSAPDVPARFGVLPSQPALPAAASAAWQRVRVEPEVPEPLLSPLELPQPELQPGPQPGPRSAVTAASLPRRLLPTDARIVMPPRTVEPDAVPAPASPDVEARLLAESNRAPDYPESARRLGHEGEVRVGVRVGPDGSVLEVWLDAACRWPELNRAALGAVRRFRFAPATRSGVPVEATIVVPIVFRLRG